MKGAGSGNEMGGVWELDWWGLAMKGAGSGYEVGRFGK